MILAGGGGARLGGVDKASLDVGGRTLLERALDAVAEIERVAVAGPESPTPREVVFTMETPPGGGPAAGLLTALVDGLGIDDGLVAVVAVDLPGVVAPTLRRLMLAADRDGALLVDADGRRQHLCGVYAVPALLAAAPPREEWHGLPMHRLLADLRLAEVEAVGDEAHDVDTWADHRALHERASKEPADGLRGQAGSATVEG